MGDWGVSLRSPTPEDLPKRAAGQKDTTHGRTDRAAAEDLASLSTERNFLLDELDLSRRQDAKAFVPDPFALTKIRAAFKADQADKTGRGLTGFFAADQQDNATSHRSPARVGLRPAETAEPEEERAGSGKGRNAGRGGGFRGDGMDVEKHIKGLVPASKVDNFGNQAQPDAAAGDEEDDTGRKRHSGWIGLDGKPLPAKRAKSDAEAGKVRHIPGRGVVASVIGNTTAPSTYKPPLSAVEKVEKRKAAKRAKDAEKAKAKAEKEAKKAKAMLIAALDKDKTPKGNKGKGKKQTAGKGKKQKAGADEDEGKGDNPAADRKAKRSKDDEPPKFRRIPKDAAPTDDFPIVQGLERQKNLPAKKRDKPKESPPLSPFPLSMPSTEASGGRLDLDKLFDGLAGKAANPPTTKSDPAGEKAEDDLDELDSDNRSDAGKPEEHLGKSLVLQRFLRGGTPPLVVVEQELEIPLGDSANPIPVDEEIVTPRTTETADQPSTISQLATSASHPLGHAATSSSQVPYSSPLAGKTTGTGEQLIMQPKPFKHSDERALTALVGFNGSIENACATVRERSQARKKPAPPPMPAKGPIPDVYNHKGFYSGDMKRKTEDLFSTQPVKKSKSRTLPTTTDSQRHPLLKSAWTPSTPSTSASESVRSSGKFNLPLAPFRKPPASAYVQPPRPALAPETPQTKAADSDTGSYTKLTMFKASAPKPMRDSEAHPRFTVETIRGSQYAGSDSTRFDAPTRFRDIQAPRFASSAAESIKNPVPTSEVLLNMSYGQSTYARNAQEAVQQSQVQRDEEWETGWTRNSAAAALSRQGRRLPPSTSFSPWLKDRSLSPQRHPDVPASSPRTQALACAPNGWGMYGSRFPQIPTGYWEGQQ